MKKLSVLFVACIALGHQNTVAFGQGIPGGVPPPVAQPNPSGPTPLDGILTRWEQEMHRIQFLTADLALLENDKTFRVTTKSVGIAKYMKAGTGERPVLLASMEWRKENKPDIEKKFLCTGNFLYELDYTQKVVRAFAMPQPKPGQVADDSFLAFLFGIKAEEAKKRYGLTLSKQDQYYYYIDIVPRNPGDRADFQRAQLVLLTSTFLPRRLWFEKPNGDEVTWDIPRIDTKKLVDRKDFDAPQLGSDWRMMQANAPGVPNPAGANTPAPRVARPAP